MTFHTSNSTEDGLLGIQLRELNSSNSNFESRESCASSRLSNPIIPSGQPDEQQPFIPHQHASAVDLVGAEPSYDHEISQRYRKRRYRFKSWKVGVFAAASMATVVLAVNTILTVWATLNFHSEGGIGTAIEGNCDAVSRWSFWLHLLINVLSSMLLSASNYTMQCVVAPTRHECDIAHSRRDWLEIGVPSIRNLLRIGWQRRIMWALLALSSIPIHLLYNSTVFRTSDNNFYDATLASREVGDNWSEAKDFFFLGSFRNLSVSSCIDTYATYYLSGHGDVVLIADLPEDTYGGTAYLSSDFHDSSTYLDLSGRTRASLPFGWMCPFYVIQCKSLTEARKLISEEEWKVGDIPVAYCLSQDQAQHCKLQFSVNILVAVVVCNAVKCIVMFWVLLRQKDTTLVTFGDALASWLERPDVTTANRCYEDFRGISCQIQRKPSPRRLGPVAPRWRSVVSRRRGLFTGGILSGTLVACVACMGATVEQMRRDTDDTITTLGFGTLENSKMLMDTRLPTEGASGLAASVLLVNLPQLIFSFVYLACNGLITYMLLANEYSGYEIHRKTLRVTTPYGEQRRTYWLQVPYAYGIPMIAMSSLVHWLISQSVFLVRVEEYRKGKASETNVSAIGLSPAPMIVLTILVACIIAIIIFMSRSRLQGRHIPVAASCSRALAAAAHRPADDTDAAVLPVKWGEVKHMGDVNLGHCCFSSQDVGKVVDNKRYR